MNGDSQQQPIPILEKNTIFICNMCHFYQRYRNSSYCILCETKQDFFSFPSSIEKSNVSTINNNNNKKRKIDEINNSQQQQSTTKLKKQNSLLVYGELKISSTKDVFVFNYETKKATIVKMNEEMKSSNDFRIIKSYDIKNGNHTKSILIAEIKYNKYTCNTSFKLPVEGVYKNIPYLKSHIQKCVRRGESEKAVKSAFHLMKLDHLQLIRRLCIIAVEDVCINSYYPSLVWILIVMSSSKGSQQYSWNENLVSFVLGLVESMCNCRERVSNMFEGSGKINQESYLKCLENEPSLTKDIALSLIIRSCFGGMEGDVNMLVNYANSILLGKINCLKAELPHISPHCVSNLSKSDWVLQAIDFHNCFDILNKLQMGIKENYYLDVSLEELKSWMWEKRSGINVRNLEDAYGKGKLESWHDIANEMSDIYAQKMISNFA